MAAGIMTTKDMGISFHDESIDIEMDGKPPIHATPVGTVRLINDTELVLIPTPSPDPRGMTVHRSLYVKPSNKDRSS